MTDSRAAVGMDRLPWLADEPAARRSEGGGGRDLLGWVVAGVLAVAGASYWLGLNSQRPGGFGYSGSSETTMALPDFGSSEPAATPDPDRPVSPGDANTAPPRPLDSFGNAPRYLPQQQSSAVSRSRSASPSRTDGADANTEQPKAPDYSPWPVRVEDGASGRLVRVGTFTTRRQAKKGWWAMMKVNPALKRLPALVVPVTSQRDGRTYYRLQMGTSSQAHSEVLCQRMRMIGQSCVVVLEKAKPVAVAAAAATAKAEEVEATSEQANAAEPSDEKADKS